MFPQQIYVKFNINTDFEVTFYYNPIKTIYSINAKYQVATLEINELDIGSFLIKLNNISNVKSYINIT